MNIDEYVKKYGLLIYILNVLKIPMIPRGKVMETNVLNWIPDYTSLLARSEDTHLKLSTNVNKGSIVFFYQQSDLFMFLDTYNKLERHNMFTNYFRLRPYCIELPLPLNLSQYSKKVAQNNDILSFIEKSKSLETHTKVDSLNEIVKNTQQTRYYVAMSIYLYETVWIRCIPLSYQHIYEIIRSVPSVPCTLYLDVEYTDNSDITHLNHLNTTCVELTNPICTSTSSYRYCDTTCKYTYQHELTQKVIIDELDTFLNKKYEHLYLAMNSNVIDYNASMILDSLPTKNKVSQHYIIRLQNHTMFESSYDVGVLLKEFIQYLYIKAHNDPVVHQGLFYHYKIECFGTDLCNKYVLKCVIDESVYSKNRAFRCIGSSKLGKESVLTLNQQFHYHLKLVNTQLSNKSIKYNTIMNLLDSHQLFGASLVTLDWDLYFKYLICSNSKLFEWYNSYKFISKLTLISLTRANPSHYDLIDTKLRLPLQHKEINNKPLLKQFTLLIRDIATPHMHSTDSRRNFIEASKLVQLDDTGHKILCNIRGTRYCRNINREHKSNNVYYIIHLYNHTWIQQCYDLDCKSLRQEPQYYSNNKYSLPTTLSEKENNIKAKVNTSNNTMNKVAELICYNTRNKARRTKIH